MYAHLLLPKVARPVGGEGPSMGPCPLHTSQQWLLASILALASSVNLAGYGTLLFCCFSSPPRVDPYLGSLPSSLPHEQTHSSSWATDSVHRSYSALPLTVWLLHFTLTRNPKDSSLSPLTPLPWVGFSEYVTSPFLQNPLRGTDLSFFQFSFPFPSFLYATQLYSDFSCSLR